MVVKLKACTEESGHIMGGWREEIYKNIDYTYNKLYNANILSYATQIFKPYNE